MFTSYRVVDLVRKQISSDFVTASDTEVARAIGVSRAAISAYKSGRDVMSDDTLMQARKKELLPLTDDQVMELLLALKVEASRTDDARYQWTVLRDLYRKFLRRPAASILLAGLGLIGLSSPTPSEAYTLTAQADAPSKYILW